MPRIWRLSPPCGHSCVGPPLDMFLPQPIEPRARAIAVGALLLATALVCPSVLACSPTAYKDDREKLTAALAAADQATVAIDGYVVEGHAPPYVGTIAIIRPTHIWFGHKQPEYRVVMASICDDQFDAGQHVRILLNEVTPDTVWERLGRRLLFWRDPTYAVSPFSGFHWAMRYKAMRQAVGRRAQKAAGR